nr:MAG TPA: hypothetical protein [Caudoviricetes sp.]
MITVGVLWTVLIVSGVLLVCLAIFGVLLRCQGSRILAGEVSMLLSGAVGCWMGNILVGFWRIVRDELKNGSRF